MTEKEGVRLLGWLFLGCLVGFLFIGIIYNAGINDGYKRGQLDYATGKIEYTIIDGKTIHYLGESK